MEVTTVAGVEKHRHVWDLNIGTCFKMLDRPEFYVIAAPKSSYLLGGNPIVINLGTEESRRFVANAEVQVFNVDKSTRDKIELYLIPFTA